jgi:3-hydroxyacyl-CoA dehydrogenase/enoyl-CoA hydratase/3-hydroxybutyryl-CoA epimerase
MTSSTSTIRYEKGEDGVVVLTLDDPSQSANTMNAAFMTSLASTIDALEADVAAGDVKGVIVTSAKKTFFAGGDLGTMIKAQKSDAATWFATLETMKRNLRRLECMGKPVVAAMNGAALGGGLEIALACHRRIALDAKGSKIGLPEVTLGLLPGGGGVTRVVRMIGIQNGLMQVLLQGRQFSPKDAKNAGLVDEVVGSPEAMLDAARAWIAANPKVQQPWDVKGYKIPGGTPTTPAFAANLPAFPANLRKQIKNAPMPAPKAIMSAAVEGAQVDFDTALEIETRYFVSLLTGQTAKNMMKAFFFDLNAVNGGASRPAGYEPWKATKVAIVGAGMMGAGIAYECARAGMEVKLKDVTVESAAKGKAYSEKLLTKAVGRGKMAKDAAEAVLARITPTDDYADLAGCDLVIEAVFENPDLKKSVFAELEKVVAPDALLGSNTSTLPITKLAQGVSRPKDFIGLHFFSPVDKMMLLEIVVGKETSDATLAKAFDVARQIRKTPIVVNDSQGFFTSRVIGRFMDEAVGMLAEGVPPASIEQAALQAGYPTGPLALTDEVSLSLAQRIRRELERAVTAAGGTFPRSASHDVIDKMVDELGRPGRAGKAGFYEYGADGSRKGLWTGLAEHFPTAMSGGRPSHGIPFADLQERMLFAEAIDTWRCFDERVLRSVEEANIGSIFGIGFPPWTGGVSQYIEGYPGGVAGFVARAQELAARYGDRFAPPASLLDRARSAA